MASMMSVDSTSGRQRGGPTVEPKASIAMPNRLMPKYDINNNNDKIIRKITVIIIVIIIMIIIIRRRRKINADNEEGNYGLVRTYR